MTRTLWVALLVAMTALAGCTDDGDDAPAALTEEDCAAQGLELGTIEAMGEDGTPTTEVACVEPGPPATLTIEDLPASVSAYTNVVFRWVLNTPSDDEMHTMDTQVRFETGARASTTSDDELGKPDTYGENVAQMEHQNFRDGQSYEASFTPTEPGTIYFRAFALVNGENIWSPEYTLEVGPIEPTGVTHTITLSGVGLPVASSADPSSLTIGLGDGVQWTTDDPAGSWTITRETGPDGQDIDTTSGGDEVVFLVPGSYTYNAEGTAGSVSGTIEVQAPSA